MGCYGDQQPVLGTIWHCVSTPRPGGRRRCCLCRVIRFCSSCPLLNARRAPAAPQPLTAAMMPTDYPQGGGEDTVALSTSAPASLLGSTAGPLSHCFRSVLLGKTRKAFPPPRRGRTLAEVRALGAWSQKTALVQPHYELCDLGQVTRPPM